MNIISNFEWHRPWIVLMRVRVYGLDPFQIHFDAYHLNGIRGKLVIWHIHTHTHTTVSVDTKLFNNALECDAIIWIHVLECEWVCVCVSHSAMLSIESAVLKFTDRIAESERLRERRGEKQHTTKPLKLKMMMMMTIPIMKRCFLCMAAWEKKILFYFVYQNWHNVNANV